MPTYAAAATRSARCASVSSVACRAGSTPRRWSAAARRLAAPDCARRRRSARPAGGAYAAAFTVAPARQAHAAVDDDAVAVGRGPSVMSQPSPFQSPTVTGRSSAWSVLVDDPDEVALGALLHRALRNHDRVGPDGAVEAHAHVLVRAQHARRVVHRGAQQERAGRRVVRRIGERDLARCTGRACRRPSRSRRRSGRPRAA